MRRDEVRGLHEQRAHLHAEMIQLNGAAEAESRDLTAEESQEFDRLCNEFEQLEQRVRRAEKLFAQDNSVQTALTTPIELRVGLEEEAPETLSEWRNRRSGPRDVDRPEFRQAIYKYLGSKSVADLDVEEHRVLSRATSAAGGYLIPTELENRIIESRRFLGSFETLAATVTTDNGDPINIPTATAFGTAVWTSENAAFTPSDDTFGLTALNAFKVSTKVIISEELLQDTGFDLEAWIARQFGLRFRVVEETAFINGDGTGKPLGVLANIPTITAATGNVTGFNYTALVTLVFALPAQYRQGASFVVSDAAARSLYLMLDTTGRPIWSIDTTSDAGNRLLGYPVYTHPDMPAPAAGAKSAMFGNWDLVYTIRRARGIGIQRQNELHSDTGQVGFRAFERLDGRVLLAAAGMSMANSAT